MKKQTKHNNVGARLKRIVILGARSDGHAKVVLEILEAMGNYQLLGFIDDDPAKKNTKIRDYTVLGNFNDLVRFKADMGIQCAIVAISDNKTRRKLGQKITDAGLELANAIHPDSCIASDVDIGKGVVCGAGTIINVGTKIADHVNINTAATIDHDNIIEEGVNISPGVHTSGRDHICRDVFVGTGAILVPDITVGEGAVVGAGAVVIRDVEPYTVVAGVPAHPIKKVSR